MLRFVSDKKKLLVYTFCYFLVFVNVTPNYVVALMENGESGYELSPRA